MSKCIHNQQIQLFCIKQNCKSPTSGGCIKCFKQLHQHTYNDEELIGLQQLQRLINKYIFPNKIKPQCVNIQQSFYNFFKKLQNQLKEIINTIDQICKNVVNTIGFPYICYNSYFTVYKRIKNKQYNRIPNNDFYNFIKNTRNISNNKLAQLQQKLYIKQITKSHQMIKQINHMIQSFQNITKYYNHKSKFIHNHQEFYKNQQIVQKIKNHIKNNNTNTTNNTNTLQTQRQRQSYDIKIRQSNQTLRNKRIFSNQQTKTNKNQLSIQNKKFNHSQLSRQNSTQNLYQNNYNIKNQIKIQQKKNLKTSMNDFIPEKQKIYHKKQRNVSIDKQISRSINNDNNNNNNNNNSHNNSSNNRFNNLTPLKITNKITKILQKQKQFGSSKMSQQSQQQSKNLIQNNNLPLPIEQEKNKIDKNTNAEITIRPVTRQLQENIYQKSYENGEISSPLLRRKMKADNLNKPSHFSETSEKKQDFSLTKNHSSKTQQLDRKTNQFSMKPLPVQQGISSLSQAEQKSFLLLISSLKLETTAAIPMLQKSLQQCQKNLSAVQYLSFLYLQSNEFQKCVKLCNKYLSMIWQNKDLTSSKVLLINNKASAFNNLGRFSQTVKMLEKYTTPNIHVFKNLGNAHLGLGHYQQAINFYHKILEESMDEEILFNLASCHYFLGNFSIALIKIQQGLNLQSLKKQFLELLKYVKIGMDQLT